eukprot:GHVR01125912.1.p1 GENE.GHVR01125912.1~~GHVR01125912.1.p1  ORF type:complete len:299 (+),score=36.17 GHVR01125912.1:285-1181(+)
MSEKRKLSKGEWLENISLAPFTTWHIGGPAEHFYWPVDSGDLQQALKQIDVNQSITWLGLGSNVLINDQGISGVAIITQGALKQLVLEDQSLIYAEAGVSCAQVARFAARNGQVSGEFLAGIPGTVGGALLMNAGAFGGETWEVVTAVKTINRQGEIKLRYPDSFTVAYRHTEGLAEDEWFLGAYFQFKAGDGKQGLQAIKDLLAKRSATQPTGEPSCGSVFQNPPGDHAGRLIESLDLKGFQIGQAQVSPKHANFFINLGGATAEDMDQLIHHVSDAVKKAYDVELHHEVKYLGFSR